jgi:uncharacterized membrane protein YkgB
MTFSQRGFHRQDVSTILGVVELTTGALLAVKPWAPEVCAVGSVLAIGLFVATLSLSKMLRCWVRPRGRWPMRCKR